VTESTHTPAESYSASIAGGRYHQLNGVTDNNTETTRPNALTYSPTGREDFDNCDKSSRSDYHQYHRHKDKYTAKPSTMNTLSTSKIAISRSSVAAPPSHLLPAKPHHKLKSRKSTSKRTSKSKHKKQARHLYKELKKLILLADEPLAEERSSHYSSI
jgi:hypothetical protein